MTINNLCDDLSIFGCWTVFIFLDFKINIITFSSSSFPVIQSPR